MSDYRFGRVIALALVSAGLAWSQGTNLGTIRGTITDSTGAVVPRAAIEIVDMATNLTRTLESDAEGNYEASGTKPGTYRVRVTLEGFTPVDIQDVVVRGSEVARADAVLRPATAAATVVITAEAPVIEMEQPTIHGSLDNRALVEVPRDSRDVYTFLYLNPNIVQGTGDGAFKFIGAQTYGASFSVDGQRTNGGIFGEPTSSQPSLETIGELTVLSNDFTAEYAGISNVRVLTKRGGNEYHGSMFYNNKNSALAAWDLQNKLGKAEFLPTPAQASFPNPYFNLNEVGASFGGRVPKVKNTYFLMAYERRWSASPIQLKKTNLPHPSMWTGDFRGVKDSAKPLVPAEITLTAAEVAQNTVGGQGVRFTTIPQRLLNPVTAKMIGTYFPPVNPGMPINASNGRLVDYFNLMPGRVTRDLGTVRLDHDFNDKNKLYWVYNVTSQTGATSPVVSPFIGLGLTQQDLSNHTVSVSYTHLFSNTLINEARGGFNRSPNFRRSNMTLRQFLGSIGFDASDITAYGDVVGANALDTYGHMAVNFGSTYQQFTNGGRNTYRPMDQSLATFGNTLSWIKGKHSLRMGADLVRNAAIDGFANNRGNPRGYVNYTGSGTDPFARFLMGLPANQVTYVDKLRPPMDVYNWEQGYFVQDDFRIHPKLTINLGLRYEIVTPFVETNDLLVNFDPTFVNSQTGQKGRFIVPSSRVLPMIDPNILAYGVVTADQAGVGRSLVHTDFNNLAPRVGAAWRITERMVLRGGYGLYYPTSAAQGMRDAMATNPFNQGRTKTNVPPAQGLSWWPGNTHGTSPISGGRLRSFGSQPSANAIPQDLQQPRIDQFNVTFERELGWRSSVRTSYLGTRMRGLITGIDLNMIPANNIPFGTFQEDGVTPCTPADGDCARSAADLARLPFPLLGDYMGSYGNYGHGRSDALQIEVNRRFASGLMLNASYTRLDQTSDAVDSGNSSLGGTAYNQFKPEHDYALDSYVPKHRFVAYGIWEVPVGQGRKFGSGMPRVLEYLVGGWQTSWNMFIKSGTGFTPFWTCYTCSDSGVVPGNLASTFIDAEGSFNYGTSFRPLVTGTPMKRDGDRIWDPAAFSMPSVGSDVIDDPRVAKRNSLWGPGTWGVNFGVRKTFRFGERWRAELGADFNNIFNHPLFSPDNADIANMGDFVIQVDPNSGKLLPITDVTPNPDFGRLITSYSQEGIDSRRTVRLRLRITF